MANNCSDSLFIDENNFDKIVVTIPQERGMYLVNIQLKKQALCALKDGNPRILPYEKEAKNLTDIKRGNCADLTS